MDLNIWGLGGFCDSVLESVVGISSTAFQWCALELAFHVATRRGWTSRQSAPCGNPITWHVVSGHAICTFFLTFKMTLSWMPKAVPQILVLWSLHNLRCEVHFIYFLAWSSSLFVQLCKSMSNDQKHRWVKGEFHYHSADPKKSGLLQALNIISERGWMVLIFWFWFYSVWSYR